MCGRKGIGATTADAMCGGLACGNVLRMRALTGTIHITITINRAGGCMKAIGITRTTATIMTSLGGKWVYARYAGQVTARIQAKYRGPSLRSG